jgi:hypothetical protein
MTGKAFLRTSEAQRGDVRESILRAWRTANRVNELLVENLPAGLWAARVPGEPRRTVRTIA